jgi:hypothetical protein
VQKYKKHTIRFLPVLTALFFLYLQIFYWQNILTGWVIFVAYVWFVGNFWQEIFARLYGMKKKDWVTRVLAWFSVFVLLGFISAIFVVFYRLSGLEIWLTYIIVTILSSIISNYVCYRANIIKNVFSINKSRPIKGAKFEPLLKKNILILLLYFFGVLIAFQLLQGSTSSAVLTSPWQSIHNYFLPIFFVVTLILGFLLFTEHKVKTLLLLIILHSFLLHAYLPLSHSLPWGGDVWRHIAVEQKLLDGGAHPPVLFGEGVKWRSMRGINIPEAILIPNKYIYGQLWGSSVLVAKTLNLDLLTINKWLIPFVWSIVFPILLFRIGGFLFGSWRYGLVFAALGGVAFTFQALGSLTLPVSFGHLTFLFVFWLFLNYLRTGQSTQRNIVFLFGALMLFGYPLHFLLFWFVVFVSKIFNKIIQQKNEHVLGIRSSMIRKILYTVAIFGSIFYFTAIELIGRISFVPDSWSFVPAIKQFVGQWSGWFYASQIRVHDILSGNIFFNHTPEWANVSNIFTVWRWQVMMFVIIVLILVIYGSLYLHKEKEKQIWFTMSLLFSTVVGGYIVGWYILDGDRSFVRRLDGLVAFVLILFFLYGLAVFRDYISKHLPKKLNITLLVGFVVITSWFTTTSYASGPDIRVISTEEYSVAKYIYHQEKNVDSNFCALSDTWVLLALEAISSGRIVGGGFPIDYQFSQPERIVIFQELLRDPREAVFTYSKKLTQADTCWVAIPTDILEKEQKDKIIEFLGEEKEDLGEWLVWSYTFDMKARS